MDVTLPGTHRLPVQRAWGLHRRLPKLSTAHDQGRGLGVVVESIGPDDPGLGGWHMEQQALEKVGYGYGQALG